MEERNQRAIPTDTKEASQQTETQTPASTPVLVLAPAASMIARLGGGVARVGDPVAPPPRFVEVEDFLGVSVTLAAGAAGAAGAAAAPSA
jgi:hypothetical protein